MFTRRALLSAIPLAAAALPKSITILQGSSNSVVLRRNSKALVIYGDPLNRVSKADQVLLTSARRDIAWSAQRLVEQGATPVVPLSEAPLFSDPQSAWKAIYSTTRLHDYANQGTHFPTQAFPRIRTVEDKDKIEWQDLSIDVIATPGYTRGAVSYSIKIDGQHLIATGDLIQSDGKIADLYSLQDAIPELNVRGYHGFATRIGQLMASLRRIQALKPDTLLPARGPAIHNPQQAIQSLLDRLAAFYANYLKTDAYRWYFGPDNYKARAKRILGDTPPAGLPYAETIRKELPSWMRLVSNSRLVVSESGEAILIDCGSQRNLNQVHAWRAEGVFKKLRAVYVTHYHDDHTDFAQTAADQFGAEVWSSSEQQDILKNPASYRMPCLTGNPIPGLKPWRDRETRDWHEFRLQNFHFPGQTIYHGALLVQPKKPGSDRVLFLGDSLTPSGVDDYCLLNRNLLSPGRGLLYCLKILEQMPDCLLVNQHVDPLFRFSPAQLKQLSSSLTERIHLISELVPWGNPNFGIDEQWFRLSPYVQKVKSGQPFQIEATVLNHSPLAQPFQIQLHPPPGWPALRPFEIGVAPDQERTHPATLTAPSGITGIQVITASVRFTGNDLRHWTECIVEFT